MTNLPFPSHLRPTPIILSVTEKSCQLGHNTRTHPSHFPSSNLDLATSPSDRCLSWQSSLDLDTFDPDKLTSPLPLYFMQRTPASKKRRAEEDLDASVVADRKHDLLKLRTIVATANPLTLREYILSKFDDASGNEALQRRPDDVLSTNPIVSMSRPGPMPSLSQSASTSPKSSTSQTLRSGATSGEATASPAHTHVTIDSTAINALSTVFSDLSQYKPPSSPSITTTSSRAATSTSQHTPASSIRSGKLSASVGPDLTRAPGIVPSTPPSSVPGTTRTSATLEKLQQGREPPNEDEELHCVRCHADFPPSANRRGSCLIDHNLEDCKRISEDGKVPSVWEYNCCGYQFEVSPGPLGSVHTRFRTLEACPASYSIYRCAIP